MKQLLITSFLFLLIVCSYGQNESNNSKYPKMNEMDSLYMIAIHKYTIEIDSFYNKYSQQNLPKIIFIENESYLLRIPDSINGYKIQFIGLGSLKKILKKNKNDFRLVKIVPLALKEGVFRIKLIPYFVRLKKRNHIFLSLSDWTIVFFEFKKGRLIYKRTENGGI